MTEVRGRGQRSEDRGQRSEVRRQRAEDSAGEMNEEIEKMI
jgi:hypothetical protein